MEKKIFLTYEQTEAFWFSKILFIPLSQLKHTRRNKACKFIIFVDDKKLETFGDDVAILFSSVSKIEVPESEYNLFKNQFKIPSGLLSLSKTKTPEDQVSGLFSKEDKREIDLYTRLRRSLTQLIIFGYRKNDSSVKSEISKFIDNFSVQSPFIDSLIQAVSVQGDFPQYRVKGKNTEEYFKYIWWGKFCIEHILDPVKDSMSEEDYKLHKQWFRAVNCEHLFDNFDIFSKMPEIFRKHSSVMFGYFLAALTDSGIDKKNIFFDLGVDDIHKNIEASDQELSVLFWVIFFRTFFIDDIDVLYPNPLIREDFYQAEFISLVLAKRIFDLPDELEYLKFSFSDPVESKLILNYEKLKTGNVKDDVLILSESDVYNPFSDNSLLFGDKRKNIGFINRQVPGYGNHVQFDQTSLKITGGFSDSPISYYGNITNEDQKRFKQTGISFTTKKLSSLIKKDASVLISFQSDPLSNPSYSALLNLYRDIVSSKTNLEEFIFVWLVNEDNSVLHSPEFTFEKDNLRKEIEAQLGLQTTILVKNNAYHSIDDVEIIRNLKIALKDYKAKNIEIVDHKFDKKYALWILEAINDYIVKYDNKDYYTLRP